MVLYLPRFHRGNNAPRRRTNNLPIWGHAHNTHIHAQGKVRRKQTRAHPHSRIQTRTHPPTHARTHIHTTHTQASACERSNFTPLHGCHSSRARQKNSHGGVQQQHANTRPHLCQRENKRSQPVLPRGCGQHSGPDSETCHHLPCSVVSCRADQPSIKGVGFLDERRRVREMRATSRAVSCRPTVNQRRLTKPDQKQNM